MRKNINILTFGGVKDTDIGVKVVELSSYKRGDERGTTYKIIGRDGDLFIPDNAVDSGSLRLKIMAESSKVKDIRLWLTGSKNLKIKGLIEDSKHFKAKISKGIQFKQESVGYYSADVTFDVQPNIYHDDGANKITITRSSTMIQNNGTNYSLPVISVYGSGDITLMVGMQIVQLNGISGGITIDSELSDAYSLDKSTLLNNKVVLDDGTDFPVLKVGSNAISWTGNVTKVEIVPNWRDV